MSYRPEGWKNPYLQQDKVGNWINSKAYEIGADAMLEALKKEGVYLNGDTVIPAQGTYPEIHVPNGTKGWLVVIPQREEL